MGDTPGSQTVSMKLQRIAQQAANYPEMVFNNLYHLIDKDFLYEAYRQTRKNAAPGEDKVTAKQYAEHLEENLLELHERLRSNRYVAPPVERVWIDKEDGKKEADRQTLFRGQDSPKSGGYDTGGDLQP